VLAAPTDEASAMERTGVDCLLIEARHPNPKITRPADLTLARALLTVAREERVGTMASVAPGESSVSRA